MNKLRFTLLFFSALALVQVAHADEGASFFAGLFGRPAQTHESVHNSLSGEDSSAILQNLALKREHGSQDDFKRTLDSHLLPSDMLQARARAVLQPPTTALNSNTAPTASETFFKRPLPFDEQRPGEPDFSELQPSRSATEPRMMGEGKSVQEAIEDSIAALKRTNAAGLVEDVGFTPQAGGEEAEDSEAAKKKKEWFMMQEIMRLQTLLRSRAIQTYKQT